MATIEMAKKYAIAKEYFLPFQVSIDEIQVTKKKILTVFWKLHSGWYFLYQFKKIPCGQSLSLNHTQNRLLKNLTARPDAMHEGDRAYFLYPIKIPLFTFCKWIIFYFLPYVQ